MYNELGYKNKVNGIVNIDKALRMYSQSDNHEVNKDIIMLIMQTAELLMQSEEMAIAYANKDPEGVCQAFHKKWLI